MRWKEWADGQTDRWTDRQTTSGWGKILCTHLVIWNVCIYNGTPLESLTKDAKFGQLPRTILYTPCMFYPLWQATSLRGPLSKVAFIKEFHCITHTMFKLSWTFYENEITYRHGSHPNKANLRDLIAATGLVILLKLESNHRFFSPCDLEIWWITQKTIGHLLYATLSFLHHFAGIGEFKLDLQSRNA